MTSPFMNTDYSDEIMVKDYRKRTTLSNKDGEEREREDTKTPGLFSISTLVRISIFSFFYFFN